MRDRIVVGPIAGAVIGFVTTWCVVALILRFVADETLSNVSALIVLTLASGAIAMLVAARARRNGRAG